MQILIETILGALTGYLTNNVALNHLFREGGVIEKERVQFTKMLVDMLSEEILSSERLEMLFSQREMQRLFQQIAHALLDETLPDAFEDLRLGELPHGSLALQHITKALKEQLDASDGSHLRWDRLYARMDEWFNDGTMKASWKLLWSSMGATTVQEALMHPMSKGDKTLGESLEGIFYDGEQKLWSHVQNMVEEIKQNPNASLETRFPAFCASVDTLFRRYLEEYPEEALESVKKTLLELFEKDDGKSIKRFLKRSVWYFYTLHGWDIFMHLADMLSKDRHRIEAMILRSAERATKGTSDSFARTVRNAVHGYFQKSEAGESWLSHLIAQESKRSKQCRHGKHIADYCANKAYDSILTWLKEENSEQTTRVIHMLQMLWNKIRVYPLQKLFQTKFFDKIFAQSMQDMHKMLWHKVLSSEKAGSYGRYTLREVFFPKPVTRFLWNRLEAWWHGTDKDTFVEQAKQKLQGKKYLYQLIDTLAEEGGRVHIDAIYEGILSPFRRALLTPFVGRQLSHVAAKNTPKAIANMAFDRICAMSDEEIRVLIRDVLGNEMQPLSYLGAGVGAVAGVATGGLMQGVGLYTDPTQHSMVGLVASRSLFYGVVGYGTNVLAVQGLFKPYTPYMGWQGLIPKNQRRFAKKMSDLSEVYILNEGIWREELAKLEQFGARYVDATLLHLQGALSTYADIPMQHIRYWLENTTFEDVVKLSALSRRLVLLGAQGLIASEQQKDKVTAILNTWLDAMIEKAFHKLTTLHEEHTVQQSPWLAVWSQRIFAYAHQWACDKLSGFSSAEWTRSINDILNKVRLPDIGLDAQGIWQRIVPHLPRLYLYFTQFETPIAQSLAREIRHSMGLGGELMYRMAGGDRYVYRAVHVFMAEELPRYLHDKQANIESIWYTTWQDVYKKSLSEMGLVCSLQEASYFRHWVLSRMEKPDAFVQWLHEHQEVLTHFFHNVPLDKGVGWFQEHQDAIKSHVTRFAFVLVTEIFWQWNNKPSTHAPWKRLPILQSFLHLPLQEFIDVSALHTRLETFWSTRDTDEILDAMAPILWIFADLFYKMVPGLMLLIRRYGEPLFLQLNLPQITYEEILQRDPETLEKMIRSIANPYLKQVERMGWLGALVAFPATLLGLFLFS